MKKLIERSLPWRSFALNELDRKLAKFIRRRDGFFVEAGANDGLRQSNSLYFEKYLGWTGLLIEAIPALAEQCRQNRPRCRVENCALVSTEYQGRTVEMQYNNLMSFVKGVFGDEIDEKKYIEDGRQHLRQGDQPYQVSVPARTLSEVLAAQAIEQIDLLSLDVEGYEAEVLGGLDLARHAPQFLLIEAWHTKKQIIDSILSTTHDELSILNTNDLFADVLYRAK